MAATGWQRRGTGRCGNVGQPSRLSWTGETPIPPCLRCPTGNRNLELVRDALGRETAWIYNADGRLETTIAPSGIETDYTYDAMGRLTTIEHPAGSAITSTITYNKLGQVASRTDFGKQGQSPIVCKSNK